MACLTFKGSIPSSIAASISFRCDFLLLDEKGRVRLEESYDFESPNEAVEIPLPKLSPGTYNAWIKVNGKAHIRPLVIERSAPKGWRQKLRNLGLPF
ncbi:MAG: hypothetical protein R2824_14525 [Saprospiraceae bacterium]|nr:hypothetical protein [Lewinella sp.]